MAGVKPGIYREKGSLTNAVGGMYVKKHFSLDKKNTATIMAENILAEFRSMIERLHWMDPKTKARALKKAHMITPHIGYSKEILDVDLINEFYKL